jgi:hypothetical protein
MDNRINRTITETIQGSSRMIISTGAFVETRALDPMVVCVGIQSSDYHAAMSDIISLCADKLN